MDAKYHEMSQNSGQVTCQVCGHSCAFSDGQCPMCGNDLASDINIQSIFEKKQRKNTSFEKRAPFFSHPNFAQNNYEDINSLSVKESSQMEERNEERNEERRKAEEANRKRRNDLEKKSFITSKDDAFSFNDPTLNHETAILQPVSERHRFLEMEQELKAQREEIKKEREQLERMKNQMILESYNERMMAKTANTEENSIDEKVSITRDIISNVMREPSHENVLEETMDYQETVKVIPVFDDGHGRHSMGQITEILHKHIRPQVKTSHENLSNLTYDIDKFHSTIAQNTQEEQKNRELSYLEQKKNEEIVTQILNGKSFSYFAPSEKFRKETITDKIRRSTEYIASTNLLKKKKSDIKELLSKIQGIYRELHEWYKATNGSSYQYSAVELYVKASQFTRGLTNTILSVGGGKETDRKLAISLTDFLLKYFVEGHMFYQDFINKNKELLTAVQKYYGDDFESDNAQFLSAICLDKTSK